MKRKIKTGDVFIDCHGTMRVITKRGYDRVNEYVIDNNLHVYNRKDFQDNRCNIADIYLGNAIDNVWEKE